MSNQETPTEFGVQTSQFAPSIWVGQIAGPAKRRVFNDKQDLTDMVLGSVAEYVARHFNGGLKVDFPSLRLEMTVRVRKIVE